MNLNDIQTAIIYTRVSTDKQKNEWESPEMQEEACRKYCYHNNIQVMGVYHEAYTWKSSDRPILKEAILNAKMNKVDFFIIFDIDRFSREWVVEYKNLKHEIENAWIKLRDSKNIIWDTTFAVSNNVVDMTKYAWNKVSASEYAEAILAMVAKEEWNKILQRTITREINLEQEWYHVRPANYWFINKKIETAKWKRPIQVKHPTEGDWMIEMFELRANSLLSDNEIVEQVNRKWCVRKNWKLMNTKYMQTLICNPIYAWINCGKWTWYEAIKTKYYWLVSIDIWNRANKCKVEIIEWKDDISIK
jgi:DNA invertase Pin-like site-specific DNA recombinase